MALPEPALKPASDLKLILFSLALAASDLLAEPAPEPLLTVSSALNPAPPACGKQRRLPHETATGKDESEGA